MSKILQNIVCSASESWTDSTGAEKRSWITIGQLMENDKGDQFIKLNAMYLSSQLNHIANREGSSHILFSLYDSSRKERKDSKPTEYRPRIASDSDDDIPF